MLLVQYSIFKYKNIICILQQVKNPKIHKEIHVTCEGDLAGVSALLLIARVAGGLKWGPSSHPAVWVHDPSVQPGVLPKWYVSWRDHLPRRRGAGKVPHFCWGQQAGSWRASCEVSKGNFIIKCRNAANCVTVTTLSPVQCSPFQPLGPDKVPLSWVASHTFSGGENTKMPKTIY